MPIRFLPNDPLALDVLPPREQPPRPDPQDPQAGFSYAAEIPEALYPLDSAEFGSGSAGSRAGDARGLGGAHAAADVLADGQRLLPLQHDAGRGLNAHYDRAAVAFLGLETDARKTYPAASTDAVAHEVGHALLDAMRPELWESVYTETAAFHEAFADCMALLVSLFDTPSRQALLQGGVRLRAANFLECLAEDVAEGVRLENGPNDPHSLPRRALNTLRWEIPVNLPRPPVPGPHGGGAQLQPDLHRLLLRHHLQHLRGPAKPGRARAPRGGADRGPVADRRRPGGARGRALLPGRRPHHDPRRRSCQRRRPSCGHSRRLRRSHIAIGSTVMLAPTSGLAGSAPTVDTAAGTSVLPVAARRDLLERIGARRGRLSVTGHELGGQAVTKAVYRRGVPLGKLDRRLKGVVVPAVESVLVGASAARAVVLGPLPDARTTVDEAHHFIGALLEHGAVAFATAKRRATRKAAAPRNPVLPTHTLQTRGGKTVLKRIRFSCGPRR